MKILVTGASGFIGSHIVRRLAATGHTVVASGRNSTRLDILRAVPCASRTANLATDNLSHLLEGTEAVVHCAARSAPWEKRDLFWSDNVVATERLIAAARQSGSVRTFVHLSSPSIYFKSRDQFDIRESFTPPKRWSTFYAETKWIAEEHVRAASDLCPIVLRPRAVFGPGDNAIVPRIIAAARSGFFPLPNGGTAWTDITYIDNVVTAVERALECDQPPAERVFNISNGESIQIRDLLRRLLSSLGLQTRLISMPRSLAMTMAHLCERAASLRGSQQEPRLTRYGVGLLAYSQTLCIDAARKHLGYVPTVSIDEGMDCYARWWRSQP